MGQGKCEESSDETKFCLCKDGFSGDGCSLGDHPGQGDEWHWLHRKGNIFAPRTSHGTVFFPQADRMYVFGGYDLNTVLDELLTYSFTDGIWLNLKEELSNYSSRKRRLHSHLRKELLAHHHHYHHRSESTQKAFAFSVNSNNTVSVKLIGTPSAGPAPHHRRARRMVPPRKEAKYKHSKKQLVWPRPRFGHCMAAFGADFVSYGGRLASGE